MSQSFPSAIPGLEPMNQGKTRDIFPAKAKSGPLVGQELMLIVATDRLSTHNRVHKSTIPRKGWVLTALTVYWLAKRFPMVGIKHHLVAHGKAIYDCLEGSPRDYPSDLHLRGIVVKKLPVLPIEFIFRARLGGSFYEKFYSKGIDNPYGVKLRPGLPLMYEFPEPIFTPTEKSETDDPLTAADVWKRHPAACALARQAFVRTRRLALARGVDVLDSKFEVSPGLDGIPVIVDEILTPDSSRFCPKDAIVLGQEPPYADKQIARDEAIRMWNGGPKEPLTFSPSIVSRLTDTYLSIFARLTESDLKEFQASEME